MSHSSCPVPRRLAICALFLGATGCATVDPLPSWEEGPAKVAILEFVDRVTTPGGEDFVPEPERVAVFDNDGTLWAEKPSYFQLAFAMDRVRELASGEVAWKDEEPFRSVLAGDTEGVLAGGEEALLALVLATHSGMTSEEFAGIVDEWISRARHPRLGRLYTECVYQPMLELLRLLDGAGFQTWIVSGGGVEFLRAWAEDVYGIPPERVVGSRLATRLEVRDGEPVLVRQPELEFINDKEGKPVGIRQQIGRRPILAFGNSDGDLAMLQWTAAGKGARLMGLVHHTDAEREWAYDRESKVGRLDRALDEARSRDWTVVDMRSDWRRVFPPAKEAATTGR